jgi:teichuronic acid exporter
MTVSTPSGRDRLTSVPAAGLGTKVRAGVAWTTVATGGRQLVNLVVQLLLARLLLPEHFGLIGMAVVFTAFMDVISELGVSSAVVQKRQQDLRPEHLDAAFWTGVGSSAAVVVLAATALGAAAAWFYEEPVLRGVVAVISLALLFRGVTHVHRALLTREMRFRELGLIRMGSVAIGGIVAVAMALLGFGVWSIAWQGVVAAIVSIPMYWLATPWRPRFRFSFGGFRAIFSFGAFVAAYDILIYLGKHLDYLLIGKFVGAASLGLYTLAFLLTDAFRTSVMGVLNQVMFPVYGKLQDSPDSARRYYLTVVRVNTLIAFPLLTLFVVFPHEIVAVVFGDKWAGTGMPLRLLAIAMMINIAGGTTPVVLRGLGHVKLQFWVYVGLLIFIQIPALLIGVVTAGVFGVAIAVIVVKFASRMIAQHYMKRLINVRELDIARAIGPATLGSIMIVVAGLVVREVAGPPDSVIRLSLACGIALLPFALIGYRGLKPEIATVRSMVARRILV